MGARPGATAGLVYGASNDQHYSLPDWLSILLG